MPNIAETPGLAVLYRWRLIPGQESTFVHAWRRATEGLRSRGSLGARLHQGADGIWYSYAQWPSAQVRAQAFELGPVDAAADASMRLAIAEHFPEILLSPIADLLDHDASPP
jgi:hypothetical protein